MSTRRDLLIELGTEELPPRALQMLRDAFSDATLKALSSRDIAHGDAQGFATPRRLAVRIFEVADHQPDGQVSRRGPAVSAAFDADGNPTKAASGFANSCGVSVDALDRLKTDKGEWLQFQQSVTGKPLPDLMQSIMDEVIAALPIPKRMRWGAGDAVFLRPVHWLMVLHGHDIVECRAFGIKASRVTRGHRFHCPEPILVPEPAAYEAELANPGHVIVDFAKRRDMIREQIIELAGKIGGRARIDEGLLDEVTALVEWPVAVSGAIEPRFLALPPEVLIETIESHQRYFPILGPDGELMPWFITVANIRSDKVDEVRKGNERVVRPRLDDALFFFRKDCAEPLSSRLPGLANVTFQRELGSLAEKSQRLVALCTELAEPFSASLDDATRAATLAKADLLTDMVYEMPELQGTMGRYYALASDENEAVAIALESHYFPRQAGDPIADSAVGRCLAVADRVDSLAAFFAIGKKPSGDRDPFGLRRAALGLMRTLIESRTSLSLSDALETALGQLPVNTDPAEQIPEILAFCFERLRGYYIDSRDSGQGGKNDPGDDAPRITPDMFQAVLALAIDDAFDFDQRLRALPDFAQLPEAPQLGAAHKRIRNILRQQYGDDLSSAPQDIDNKVFSEDSEIALYAALESVSGDVATAAATGDYVAALQQLGALQAPVDDFFENVMVMDEDPKHRSNRLALLVKLDQLCRRVADISLLN